MKFGLKMVYFSWICYSDDRKVNTFKVHKETLTIFVCYFHLLFLPFCIKLWKVLIPVNLLFIVLFLFQSHNISRNSLITLKHSVPWDGNPTKIALLSGLFPTLR